MSVLNDMTSKAKYPEACRHSMVKTTTVLLLTSSNFNSPSPRPALSGEDPPNGSPGFLYEHYHFLKLFFKTAYPTVKHADACAS